MSIFSAILLVPAFPGLQNINAQLIVEDLKDFLKNNIVSMGAKQEENKRINYEIKTS